MKLKIPQKINLAYLPTPIRQLGNWSRKAGHGSIWIKRDDLTGIELSGNKIRKLEFLLAEAEYRGAKHVVTCGGIQSNHCRTTAYAAAQLGMNCTLFLRGEASHQATGNELLDRLTGCSINYVTAEEYEKIDEIMAGFAAANESVYVIPEGGSNATGAWGYVSCFNEIEKQNALLDLPIDTIVVATGSGGTHAGLLLGKLLSNSKLTVCSVNVCDDAGYFKHKISSIIREFALKNNIDLPIEEDEILIYDGFAGDGYGVIDSAVVNTIREFARMEGIVLDPVYGAKALRGMTELLSRNKLSGENILFIHTGGIFGLFAKNIEPF